MRDLDAVPESIPWPKVAAFLEDLGIDLDQICGDGVGGVLIGWDCIRARIYATDGHGMRYLDRTSNEVAVHNVAIRLDHENDRERMVALYLPAMPR